jgi:hypothetical protein
LISGFRAPFELLFGRNFIINLVHVGGFFASSRGRLWARSENRKIR